MSHNDKANEMTMSQNDKANEILRQIDNCQDILFAVTRKTNVIAHTGIVLIFDGTPMFTIDFAPKIFKNSLKQKKVQMKAATAGSVEGSVTVNYFNKNVMKIFHDIRLFAIGTKLEKEKAKELFFKLLNIEMGKYKLTNNNCRDYVIEAYRVISNVERENLQKLESETDFLSKIDAVMELEKMEENQDKFEKLMTITIKQDDAKFSFGRLFGATGSLGQLAELRNITTAGASVANIGAELLEGTEHEDQADAAAVLMDVSDT